jgi:hypothetical protein
MKQFRGVTTDTENTVPMNGCGCNPSQEAGDACVTNTAEKDQAVLNSDGSAAHSLRSSGEQRRRLLAAAAFCNAHVDYCDMPRRLGPEGDSAGDMKAPCVAAAEPVPGADYPSFAVKLCSGVGHETHSSEKACPPPKRACTGSEQATGGWTAGHSHREFS